MAHRILLVDDEVALRRIAARALRSEQFEVVEASDGFEAWGLAKKMRFDLVITDSRMPNLSGSQLVTRLRELRPTQPILRLSGSQDPRSEDAPSDISTLLKPFSIDELVVAVRSQLAR
jgi:DNA-binding response OmpR family regulator